MAVQGYHAFDMLANGIDHYSKHSNEFYLKFLTVDELNNFFDCYIPQRTVEEFLKKKIEPVHLFSKDMAGTKLKISQGKEISGDEFDIFLSGEKLFQLLIQGNNRFLIISFDFDTTFKNSKILPLYNKVAKFYNNPFVLSPGNFNYIEGGYDVNSAFDGNPEAYWNID